ncbi:MAG: hypothetical protein LBN03_00160, partial [Bifidobacteriaceae bacterium]|nr:hypothetical protein [Bifidobacteriaceae bacterium]
MNNYINKQIVLIEGKSDLLVHKKIAEVLFEYKTANTDAKTVDIESANYEKSELISKLSPDLFGDSPLLIVNLSTASPYLVDDFINYLPNLANQSELKILAYHLFDQKNFHKIAKVFKSLEVIRISI